MGGDTTNHFNNQPLRIMSSIASSSSQMGSPVQLPSSKSIAFVNETIQHGFLCKVKAHDEFRRGGHDTEFVSRKGGIISGCPRFYGLVLLEDDYHAAAKSVRETAEYALEEAEREFRIRARELGFSRGSVEIGELRTEWASNFKIGGRTAVSFINSFESEFVSKRDSLLEDIRKETEFKNELEPVVRSGHGGISLMRELFVKAIKRIAELEKSLLTHRSKTMGDLITELQHKESVAPERVVEHAADYLRENGFSVSYADDELSESDVSEPTGEYD